MGFSSESVLHTPALTRWQTADDIHLALDEDGPNWIATDPRGARVLDLIDGRRTLADVTALARLYPEPARSLQHVMSFAQALLRAGIARLQPFARRPYAGRAERLTEWNLREMWLHTNNSCNLACEHCLVSSGPAEGRGLSTGALLSAIDQAAELGAERFFFTGGEPFLRGDLRALAERVTVEHGRELVVLTNAILLDKPAHRALLEALDRSRVRFQVSIDGARAEDNDAIRGEGTFARAASGLALLSAMGFETSLTVVPCRRNLRALPEIPALAKRLGAASVHLMWAHRRGRGLSMLDELPRVDELLPVVRTVRDAARHVGVRLDNLESLALRVNAVPEVKHDLGMAGVESLCLFSDGVLYPSAAIAGHPELAIGRLDRPLLEVWQASTLARELRALSLAKSPAQLADPLRFISGGGDLEHAFLWSGSFLGGDPYLPLMAELARDLMADLARAGRARALRRAGRDTPVVYHAMGEGALACGDEVPGAVRTVHSNCVLAFDVDRPRSLMRAFYGEAAVEPKQDLCCPVRPSAEDLRHIPADVVERFYGCGSPVQDAALAVGETHLDLGSGAGIDVFVAARYVGSSGRSIGVDMTEPMLAVARENQPIVAKNLGFDVVTFHQGLLEQVPLPDRHVDCVTSNCVINLSPDKRAVFSEIWRVLKDHGRVVLSDIVSEHAVPPHLRVNPELWGECLSGALTADELLAELERAGFHGVEVLRRAFWRKVQGHTFSTVTVRAYKHEAAAREVFVGHRAVYLGPYKSVTDEDGLLFRRDEPVEVSTDTAAKLAHAPYAASFAVYEPAQTPRPIARRLAIAGGGATGCCS
ncbi:MAG: methyltransferase domain-containing protein [Deltaproteobacteria bacterium]|nr:methyltransferase domain-containing protein [Deltaproteobacteria bacterium]